MRILGSPTRYVQGNDVLDRSGEFIAPLGTRVFVFGDELVLGIVRQRMGDALSAHGAKPFFGPFNGECCWSEVRRLRSLAEKAAAQVIVGVGGGKAADTAKVLNMEMGVPIAIVPTIAATDAPTSHLVAMYVPRKRMSKIYLFDCGIIRMRFLHLCMIALFRLTTILRSGTSE